MFESIRHESSNPSIPTLFSYTRTSDPTPVKSARSTRANIIEEEDDSDEKFGRLYGSSPAMAEVFHMIERVAPSDVSVLIVGESGCGKELIAQTIHELSSCADAPFIAINCGALPATLIESELFGYEKGAFTGAQKMHQGFFERAQGGTLFLDEITEMPIDLQVRLLRVLETGRLVRVGGDKEIECDVRVLAATNREPLEAVRDGRLRQDLLYRLAVFPIVLPPLRNRDDDVVLLAQRFLKERNDQYNTHKYFADGVEEKLRQHDWPGNVRELKNCVQRAYIMADKVVDIDTLVPLKPCERTGSRNVMEFEIGTPLEEVERQLIFATLDRFQGNKRRVAKALGVSLKTIYNRLNGYSTDKDDSNTLDSNHSYVENNRTAMSDSYYLA
ncbi:sigma-54 interaction domain-containing protein [Chitinimonas sp. BJB300]|uniref:sigma-54 interaction domain-containing protein n=1 Tax=Chitinimonas sp. BJB300 TaxID=1559339 RepID=UPI000C0FB1E3|nr:sigma-54 dependent transcriptional regulator [Chitinimonas sp. BJB300]PHV09772.1 sigma-54-dependent Fis family transcriptional regulator [Chitinimonas sp. BJB300]TSJ90149.1 sigma-54-dependent Fis family transcriptional regulator [Chitinimonas sp. BJB300]